MPWGGQGARLIQARHRPAHRQGSANTAVTGCAWSGREAFEPPEWGDRYTLLAVRKLRPKERCDRSSGRTTAGLRASPITLRPRGWGPCSAQGQQDKRHGSTPGRDGNCPPGAPRPRLSEASSGRLTAGWLTRPGMTSSHTQPPAGRACWASEQVPRQSSRPRQAWVTAAPVSAKGGSHGMLASLPPARPRHRPPALPKNIYYLVLSSLGLPL